LIKKINNLFLDVNFQFLVINTLDSDPELDLDSDPDWYSAFAAQGAPPVSLTQVANGKNLQSEKFYLFFGHHCSRVNI
jgi:hypothetical protein